ncbi:MAG: hypothetical protein F6J93_32330 [Oscillatoria sp. SIO1A7]|nr:hypothetical protein [Oscillatoria sp. SIO1A7]
MYNPAQLSHFDYNLFEAALLSKVGENPQSQHPTLHPTATQEHPTPYRYTPHPTQEHPTPSPHSPLFRLLLD